jgi:hypothetical protein
MGAGRGWRALAILDVGEEVIRWSIAVLLVLSLPLAAQGSEDFSDHLGAYFCLRATVCQDRCLTDYDDRCSKTCKSAKTLCEAYRSNDEVLFRAMLHVWASKNLQRPIPERPPIGTVGQLVQQCESEQPLEREDCVNLVGAWGTLMIKRGREPQMRMKVRPRVACPRLGEPVSDMEFAQAFVRWAREHRSEWDLSPDEGINAAIAAAWPCPDAKAN